MTSMPERDNLEAILRRAGQGDAEAWRVLVDTYSGRVFGLIRAQCNDTDLADEITQSTFCTIVAKIGSYTELGKFEQWLFRIAMNRLRDEMRRRKRQARPMDDETLAGLISGGGEQGRSSSLVASGAGGTLWANPDGAGRCDPADLQALRAALSQLSEADQLIIHLRHYADLSFKQIADMLNQPLGTALARHHRALKKLGEMLGGLDGKADS